MEQLALTDKNIHPDAKVLAGCLGAAMPAWNAFTEVLKTDFPLISTEWRYYNDGKAWLFKVTKKSKTICWVGVHRKYFRAAFYFGAKAEDSIKKSSLDAGLKKQYLEGERYGKIRAIKLEIRKKADLKPITELIELKEKAK